MKIALFLILLLLSPLYSTDNGFQFISYKTNGALSTEFLKKLKSTFQSDTFFETGTYRGATTLNAAAFFNQVYTVEVYKPLFKRAQKKFRSHSNIHSYLGNSAEVIATAGKKIKGNTLFWLDAHYSGEGTGKLESVNSGSAQAMTPIREELAAIHSAGISNCAILIDDIRGFGTEIAGQVFLGCWAYPTLQEVKAALIKINPKFELALLGDILLAYDASKYHPQFSETVKACTKTRLYNGYNLSDQELVDLEKQIQGAPPPEASFIASLYESMSCYEDPMFWHDLWYGLTRLGAKDFTAANLAFQKVPIRIQSGILKTPGLTPYVHKSLNNYTEQTVAKY